MYKQMISREAVPLAKQLVSVGSAGQGVPQAVDEAVSALRSNWASISSVSTRAHGQDDRLSRVRLFSQIIYHIIRLEIVSSWICNSFLDSSKMYYIQSIKYQVQQTQTMCCKHPIACYELDVTFKLKNLKQYSAPNASNVRQAQTPQPRMYSRSKHLCIRHQQSVHSTVALASA